MANRTIQNYLSSGEAVQIKLGGTNDTDIVVKHADISNVVLDPVYCCFQTSPDLSLVNTFQKVQSWTSIISPIGVTYSNGDFTANVAGVYQWNLERVYLNYDNNPSEPIKIYIDIKNNDFSIFERDIIISAATSPSEPAVVSFNSPFIFRANVGDVFNFYVKAEEGTTNPVNPSNTKLKIMQLSAFKIAN